ncbi:MAG TPA: twin-arginine translocase TatA/TatE family subunit [Candidatus Acidoferrales bacterium]
MLSIPHLIIIFIVALIVFGPQKLPELARNLGKIMAEFRRATGDLRSTFDEHMRELEREAQAIEVKKRDLEVREAAVRLAQSSALAQPPVTAEATNQADIKTIDVVNVDVTPVASMPADGVDEADARAAKGAAPELPTRSASAAVPKTSPDSLIQESSSGSK